MTHTEAREVKDILMQCQGTIPATHVDRIYHYYKTYINPNVGGKPCTCSPTSWNQFLRELKDKVEQTLNQVTLNEQNIEVDGGHQEKSNA
jgi:hypothetical protein